MSSLSSHQKAPKGYFSYFQSFHFLLKALVQIPKKNPGQTVLIFCCWTQAAAVSLCRHLTEKDGPSDVPPSFALSQN